MARARIELGDGYGRTFSNDGTPLLTVEWGTTAPKTVEYAARSLIAQIRNHREAERKAAAQIEVAVQELRNLGASWAVIAAAVGTSKAAAHKRYGSRELF